MKTNCSFILITWDFLQLMAASYHLSPPCQAAQMVPIHLDIFLGSSIQADSPKTILLDNWVEVSTSIQPDKYWATCDSVIQGRPLTYICSAPGYVFGAVTQKKKEDCFTIKQGRFICLTSLTRTWPVKLIQNYWSAEGEAPQQEKMRCVNTKDVFMEKWITQNTRAGRKIQSRWWKGKEDAYVNAAFYQQVGRRDFMTSTQLPLQSGLISHKSVPCGQERTEGCSSSQSFKPSRHTNSSDKLTCQQKHISFEAVYSKS